ncbi:MAG: aldehyde dehydrogenase family protein [Solirubrobacteraceae bacterium]
MATATEPASPAARFLERPKRMLIDGEWIEARHSCTLEVYDPALGEVIDHVPSGDAEDVGLAVTAARRALEDSEWSRLTASERGRLIWRIGDLILENAEELAAIESLDNGKPLSVACAVDVPLAGDLFHYMAGFATKIHGQTFQISGPCAPGAQFHAYTLKEPIGVVGQIIPWNFPLLMAARKLGPALATGCTVVLKPAEQTPLSALRLAELMQEAGLPNGVVNVVTGFGETAGAAVAAHPGIDKVAFTGSTEIGKLIVKATAENLKRVTLELGGKSPNVVFADADLETAIPGVANAIFFNHEQCCCTGSRLYIERAVYDDVLAGVADHAEHIKVGRGSDAGTEMGPLVSAEQLERVTGFLESGWRDGVRTVVGGGRIGDRGYFVAPTVLEGAGPGNQVFDEEIFGPVVTVIPFKDPDEVPPAADKTVYGLAAGIWTNDLSKVHGLIPQLKAGAVWVNTYNIFDAALPFGGYKRSGWGRETGEEVIHEYTETKSVCIGL